ncbi:MAG: hypothetical protein QMD71_03315 [bacterium]|nr:hypothetical protein [bacterium]
MKKANPKSKISAGSCGLEAYPNPFRDKTVIRVQGLGRGLINQTPTLQIYDLAGRIVKSFPLITSHLSLSTAVYWDGSDNDGKKLGTGKMLILR